MENLESPFPRCPHGVMLVAEIPTDRRQFCFACRNFEDPAPPHPRERSSENEHE